jgi:hypothetical protein
LGDWIYGADQETLEQNALQALQRRGWNLAVVEAGLGGELIRKLASAQGPFLGGEALPGTPGREEIFEVTDAFRQARGAKVGMGVTVLPGPERQEVYLVLVTPEGKEDFSRPYGGPASYAARWAVNHSLDLLRRL